MFTAVEKKGSALPPIFIDSFADKRVYVLDLMTGRICKVGILRFAVFISRSFQYSQFDCVLAATFIDNSNVAIVRPRSERPCQHKMLLQFELYDLRSSRVESSQRGLLLATLECP